MASYTTTLLPHLPLHHRNAPAVPSATTPRGSADARLSRKPGVAPLQGFVQELTRTSGTMLQIALCGRRTLLEIASAPVASTMEATAEERPHDSELVPPGPLAPSPLLCPHRTFLASLILASKFLQIDASAIELGRNFLVSALAKLATAKRCSVGARA